ncbi:hypothetical protein G6F50_016588 [Rhizopus delemar]|uniref:Uncharacterized protein n=1 Tax=Rhizopus delemar TaxID=936053 RepID=A0A9P7C0Z4_9FUNG|nr:hypothetical protein G6F50_016588 [Rhizopus delemar]
MPDATPCCGPGTPCPATIHIAVQLMPWPMLSTTMPGSSGHRWTNRCRRCSAVGAAHEPVVPAGPGGAGHLAAAAADPPRPAPSVYAAGFRCAALVAHTDPAAPAHPL